MKHFRTLFALSAGSCAAQAFAAEDLTAKLIEQAGQFHPVLLHFPVTLTSLLPLLVVVSHFEFGRIWRRTLPYFIHASTLTAIAASAAGFAFEVVRGESEAVQRHMQLGLAACALLALLSLYVIIKRPKWDLKVPAPVTVLSFICAATLGLAAHIGGESVHGSLFPIFESGEEESF